jgi:hypothetical protein
VFDKFNFESELAIPKLLGYILQNGLGIVPYTCEGAKEAREYADMIIQKKVDAVDSDFIEMRRNQSPLRNSPLRDKYIS